jgi:DNA-binding IclR family transcriptional regulator
MATPADRRTLATTANSLRVIRELKELDGARVTELADEMDLAASTVHSHLVTLEATGYVVKEGDIYRLGLKFLDLGEYVRKNHSYYAMAEPKVDQLAKETAGRAHFIVEEHGRGVYVYTRSGEHAVETFSRDGRRLYLHQAAAGKAILAALSPDRLETVLDRHGLPGRTENTVTDREELYDELAAIRDRDGVAYNMEEQIRGLRAVGTSVTAPDGSVVGGLSVSGPTHRMKGDRLHEEIPDVVLGTANELELQIEYA